MPSASPRLRAGMRVAIRVRLRRRRNPRIAPSSAPDRPIACLDARRPVADDDAAPDEIDQMGVHRATGGALQSWLKPDIELVDDCVDPLDAAAQAVEDAGFTLAPMGDEGADMR